MPDTLTAVWQFTKPQVGGSTNTWGGKLNTDVDALDDLHARPRPVFFDATSGAGAVNLVNGLAQEIDITTPITVAVSNVPTNPPSTLPIWTRIWLRLKNGGGKVTWPGSVTWLSGEVPELNTAGIDVVMLGTTDNGTTYVGDHLGAGIADKPVAGTLAEGATIPVDLQVSDTFSIDFSAVSSTRTDTFTLTGASRNRRHLRVYVTPVGVTGGGPVLTVAWPASVHWLTGVTPIFQTNDVAKIVVDLFTPDAGVTWFGSTSNVLGGSTQRTQVSLGALALTRGSQTTISFNTPAVFDTPLLMYNHATNPTRLTVPVGYTPGAPIRLVAEASWNPAGGNTAGSFWVGILKNGAPISAIGMNQAGIMLAAGHTTVGANLPFDVQFEFLDPNPIVGDYYEMFVQNDSTVGGIVGAQFTAIRAGNP
jgi:hypothetical protein